MKHIFRSATDETIPLFPERLACLREAGSVLYQVMGISAVETFLVLKLLRILMVASLVVSAKPTSLPPRWSISSWRNFPASTTTLDSKAATSAS